MNYIRFVNINNAVIAITFNSCNSNIANNKYNIDKKIQKIQQKSTTSSKINLKFESMIKTPIVTDNTFCTGLIT